MSKQWNIYLVQIIYLSIFLFFISACESGDDDPIEVVKPKLLSSLPANSSTNLEWGEQNIILTYDQNVVLVLPHGITLNGAAITAVSAYMKEVTIKVDLEKETSYKLNIPAGAIKGPTGGLSDEITLSFSTKPVPVITKTLVTPNASKEANNVYDFLLKNYGVNIVSGAMANVAWNTYEAQWVYKHTGKYPALTCFDYLHLYASPANWINYEKTEVVEDWWSNNGLIAASWHWNVPAAKEGTYGFYAIGSNKGEGETNFDISQAVIEGTNENKIVKADLNSLADNLLLLKEKNIPIIWRPLHEASGKWFWWGSKGSEPYKKLWKFMFDTFKEKGLNNLIWVWTSQTNDLDWYPGDTYVDIIGCDLYNKNQAATTSAFESLSNTFPDKMITLSEFGNVAPLSDQWNAGAKWSWMMPWYNYERTNDPSSDAFNEESHIHADISFWKNALSKDYVITRDKMPSLK